MSDRKQLRKHTKLSKTEILAIVAFSIIVLVFFLLKLYGSRYDLVESIYKNCDAARPELTQEQKLEDFDYYYDTMISSFPMFESYEAVLGYDFADKKEYFREMVASTESDLEFYCVMCAIANEFPSFHTDIVFPRYNSYRTLGCYNMTHTLCNKTVYPASIYWDELLKKEYESISDVTFYCYSYLNGEYILINEYGDFPSGTKLSEINGIDINTYVFENQFSSYSKKYDSLNGNIYMRFFYINDKFGEPIDMTLVLPDGSTVHKKAFRDVYSDIDVILYNAYYDEESELESVYGQTVYSFTDDENNIGYINIASMDYAFKDEIARNTEEISKYPSVIIDLRNNYGGYTVLCEEYIYPYIFSDRINVKNKWYMLDSPNNRCVKTEEPLRNILGLKFKQAEDKPQRDNIGWLTSYENYEYNGKADIQPNVYVLVNNATGSAADSFTSALKSSDAVTVIGENTGGEGLADSFICDYLPNSGLVFVYMYGQAYNPDGTDNSLFGTAPDIHSFISADGLKKCGELYNSGIDPYTYENRLKWDDVLIGTLELIKEKGNYNE